MVKKIASLSAIALTTAFMSTGSFAHTGDNLADGSGNKVLDGRGECVVATFGEELCHIPAPVVAPAPKQAPAVVPKVPKRIVENVSFSGDALFATNSDVLTNAGKASIDPIVKASEKINNFKVSLFGHADSHGAAGYNQKLSERRAQSVADYMVAQGVDAASISVFGRGETEPVASNATAEGRAKNRRVDISFGGETVTLR